MTDTPELTKSVETALAAFNEYKGLVEGFKTRLDSVTPKMDAFDAATFDRLQKDIGTAIELSQKEQAARKAAEDQAAKLEGRQRELEAELTGIKTALNRPAQGDATAPAAEAKAKVTALFNRFARSDNENRESLAEFLKRNTTADEQKALAVNADANGGYLVMPEFGGVIQAKVFETSPVRQLASVVTIGTDTYEVVTDNDEAGSGWVGETAARPATGTPTLGKIVIPTHELYASPRASQKSLDDMAIDVEAWLAGKVAAKFARDEATAFVSGNGVGKPKGLLSYTAGTDISAAQVEQVNSGSSGAFTYAGLVGVQNALKEPYQVNAAFLLRRASNAAVMTIVDGQGRPIFNMTYDKNAGLQPTVLGKDVYFAADVPAVGVNALAAVYGDLKTAYQIVDRVGIRILRDPYSGKPNVEFYTTKRVGGSVTNYEAYKILKLA